MSELKAYNVVATADVNPEVVDILGCTEWLGYDKDEADKVIAEKDKELRHHKYKRCLNMAMVCSSYRFAWSFIPEDDEVHKSNFYKKWELRWLELADKFKPNN